MTPESFAVIAASVAIAVLLVTDLKVPAGSLRRWLLRGPHVETTDETYGPWYVVGEDGQREEGEHPSPGAAAGHLSGPQRVRAWAAELVSCPWCAGAYIAAAALGLFAIDRGADVLVFWPSIWLAGSGLAVGLKALGER